MPGAIAVGGTILKYTWPILMSLIMGKIGDTYANKQMMNMPGPTPPTLPPGVDPAKVFIDPSNPNVFYKLGAGGRVNSTPFAMVPGTPGANPATYTYPGKGLANTAGKVGSAVASVLPFVVSSGLNLAGRATQGASVAAGGLVQAAGNAPAHLLSAFAPSAKQAELYGGDILQGIGGISSDLGTAAGAGVSAIGNAAGQSLNDIANMVKMLGMQKLILANLGKAGAAIKGMGLSPRGYEALGRTMTQIGAPGAGAARTP